MNELPPLRDRAALVRTRLALERTLMAWVRTAIAMITFGFALFKFVEYAHALGLREGHQPFSASSFGLVMIIMGLVALILATFQNIRHARAMRAQDVELPLVSEGTVLALLFAAVGVLALLAAVLHR